ncbi:hypothetical protein [Halobacterium litoreum]|uniref:PH domain-containing protein n=1 Tax=Halobacterium litoreum TaxID=2039234 RepID=A0ABD5ND52_9EURY|nr:hypothetical protein [Halobacterium litoreum]UHH14116.1 hypothetical protein LT972_03725 [Halobacterium litoreum]
MTRVEWTYTVETSRFLRLLAVAGTGAIGSLFVFLAVALGFVVVDFLLAGEFAILGVLLAFGLLGARRLATHAALFGSETPTVTDLLPARELLAASVSWAVLLVALVAAGVQSELAFGALVLVAFVALPLVAFLRSDGYVDTDEGVVAVDRTGGSGRDGTLAGVDAVRRYDLGHIAVLRVRYHDGTGSSAPRLLTVPVERAGAVKRALVSSDAEPPESDRNPLIAKTLYAFALGSFAVAAGFGYFAWTADGDATGIGVYVALFVGVFGLLFAWLGYTEG